MKHRSMAGRYQRGPRTPKVRRQITVRLPEDLIDYAEREAYLRSSRPPYDDVSLSDVIRIALQHLRNTAAASVPETARPCSVVVCGDHSFCAKCGLNWDTNDRDPPKCPYTEGTTDGQ